jgi:hypothetical protein
MQSHLNEILQQWVPVNKKYTYIGIGSAINCSLEQLNEKNDQIVPVFIRNLLAEKKSVFSIHFDPFFKLDVMKEYFKERHSMMEFKDLGFAWLWSCVGHTILICPKAFEHKQIDHDVGSDDLFLMELISHSIASNKKMILQEYTGFDTVCILKKLFAEFNDKWRFKENILFDISYGTDCGCQTDLTKYGPLTKRNGDFYNFLLYSESELLAVIGKDPMMDTLIYGYFKKKWIQVLNDNHVNYRRRLKGEDCLFRSDVYDTTSSPSIIMEYLQNQLVQMMVIFHRLGSIDDAKEKEFNALLDGFAEWDVYKWYSATAQIP